MKQFVYNRNHATSFILITVLALFSLTKNSDAQIVPYYPIEIYLNPYGQTNAIPGGDPTEYEPFAAVKVIFEKNVLSGKKSSLDLSFVGNLVKYYEIGKNRDFNPFTINPTLRTFYFVNDVVTVGTEGVYVFENQVGTVLKSGVGQAGIGYNYNNPNYRYRARPFMYLIPSPNLIMQLMGTFGYSTFKHKVDATYKNQEGDIVTIKESKARWTNRLELQMIYLSKIQTRFFFIPYVAYNKFREIRAQSVESDGSQGVSSLSNPTLTEVAIGGSFGLRYMNFRWGYGEFSIELERNFDTFEGANSHLKTHINVKWENQYFTKLFGFLLTSSFIHHRLQFEASKGIGSIAEETTIDGERPQIEIRLDAMPIFNLNKNVSIRPEYDMVYIKKQDNPGGTESKPFVKHRYWLHLHTMF